jgi:hypothetical protein
MIGKCDVCMCKGSANWMSWENDRCTVVDFSLTEGICWVKSSNVSRRAEDLVKIVADASHACKPQFATSERLIQANHLQYRTSLLTISKEKKTTLRCQTQIH